MRRLFTLFKKGAGYSNYIELIMFPLSQGTPVGALTGTADTTTQKTIMNVLCLRSDATKIYVSLET